MMLLPLLACSDTGLSALLKEPAEAVPAISVAPSRLDFWSVGAGEAAVLPFTVTSVGEANLQVTGITLAGAGAFTLANGEAAFDLAPGESRVVDVVFAPTEPGEQSAVATVTSDDPDAPAVDVELFGEGWVPSLVITPDPWDFGALPLGCTDGVELTLQNVGPVPLDIRDVTFEGLGMSFTPHDGPPWTLEPYAYATGTVTFSPAAVGAASGTLTVDSTDPRGIVTATQSGEGLDAETVTDRFDVPVDPAVDVLFAIDRSASMDDDAAGLAAAFTTFIERVGSVTSGWHLGVVTTDEGCLNGGVLDAGTPDLATTFTAAVTQGSDRDIVYDEALFQIVDAALGETASGGCNEGFLRDDALLHVIVVSDEPERSAEIASAWTWDWYLPRFESHVTSPSLLQISGVVDVDGCNEGHDGYAQAIAATGGEALSICAGDWADRVATLADASLGFAWTFPLSATPVVASIDVTVDGVNVAGAWTYDEGLNAVVLDTGTPGAEVEITYAVTTGCP